MKKKKNGYTTAVKNGFLTGIFYKFNKIFNFHFTS